MAKVGFVGPGNMGERGLGELDSPAVLRAPTDQ
jgi:hypothetical protein